MLELTVLTVPDCPNACVLDERLAQALSGRPPVTITRHVVDTETDAARLGMHGSPTLLINGVDMFAAPGTPVSVSCRLYRDEAGPSGGAPSAAALREALERASGDPVPAGLGVLAQVMGQAAGRAGLGWIAPVQGGLRAVHQRVLSAFAGTGQPPTAAELDEAARPYGATGAEVMSRLHAADFLRLDERGTLSAAYPFSPAPTPHRVQISGGPQVHAMCAIDALGIAAMVGKDVTVRSADLGTGDPIAITIPAHPSTGNDAGNNAAAVVWEPASAVLFYGQQQPDCGTCPPDTPHGIPAGAPAQEATGATALPVAADICCGTINFFTSAESAHAWASRHPHVTGQVLTHHDAWQIGVRIFGPLLHPLP